MRKCCLCRYFKDAGEFFTKGRKVKEALEETVCPCCGIGFCKEHLPYDEPEDWQKILTFGRQGKEPSIIMNCSECERTFCKYRLFSDSDQEFECYFDGPNGRTPVAESCLMSEITDYQTESFVCELPGCENDVAFCSFECKNKHSPRCRGCYERVHKLHPKSTHYCEDCKDPDFSSGESSY